MDCVTYLSAEHYMIAKKARLFEGFICCQKIINAESPVEAKRLGREVSGFKEDVWAKERYKIVKKGNLAKFSQNKDLIEYLLSTGSRVIVEASPVDKICGIGLTKDNKYAENPLKWNGLNLLGFALMEVGNLLNKK